MKLLLPLVLLASSLFITGCENSSNAMGEKPSTPPAEEKAAPVQEADLKNKYFLLHGADGVEYTGKNMYLMFDEGMQVAAMGCNHFKGVATLKDGVLSIPNAASTRRMCVEDSVNKMDTVLQETFTKGAKLTLENGKLMLDSGDHKLSYVQAEKPAK